MLHSINHEQRLYVMPCGRGYSCIGFDVAERQLQAVRAWVGLVPSTVPVGTPEHFAEYQQAMHDGAMHNQCTGQRCDADLEPRLRGLERRRVEVCYADGTKRRFYVGKSGGWMPVYLEIARRDSLGGVPVYLPPDAAVTVIR